MILTNLYVDYRGFTMNYSGSYINLFFFFELLILKMVMNAFKPNN